MKTFLTGVIIAMVAMLISCGSLGREVEYRVTGTATDYSIGYLNSSGGMESRDDIEVSLPFTLKIADFENTQAWISATNLGTGTLTVQLLVNGKEEDSESISGSGSASAIHLF